MDSQSSIEILKSTNKLIRISDTLRSEMDVALEINKMRVNNPWIERKVVKVMSHIDREQAPDVFLWECNRLADLLATAARTFFPQEVILSRKPLLFPGTRRLQNPGEVGEQQPI